MSEALLRRPAVEQLTGLSRSSLYRMMDAKEFPRPKRIGARAVAWPSSEIEKWIAERPEAIASETP